MIRIENIISDFQSYTGGLIDCSPIQKSYILAVKHFSQAFIPGQNRLEMALDRAQTLTELEMDIESIVAAILLDIHLLKKIKEAELIEQLGKGTFVLIEQTISIMALSDRSASAAEVADSLRNLVKATITDIRTLILTLAARKAQLLGKSDLRKQKLKRISKEALDIYAPMQSDLASITSEFNWKTSPFLSSIPKKQRKSKPI